VTRQIPDYAELHCLSNFSFLRGASHPEELVETAHGLGYRALALTDECSLAGIVRAHLAAKARNLQLILGTEIDLSTGPSDGAGGRTRAPACPTRLLLLATDRASYGDLAALITRGRRQAAKGAYRLTRDDLADALPGCLAILLPPRSCPGKAHAAAAHAECLDEQAGWLARTFPTRAWLAVELLGEAGDRAWLAQLEDLGSRHGLPCVACGDVHMHVRERHALQDTLTAIRLKCTVAEAGYRLYPNGERHLRERERLARIYPPQLLAETLAIAERCSFSLDSLRYEYPQELVPAGETPASHLRTLTAAGFRHRYGEDMQPAEIARTVSSRAPHADAHDKVRAQIERELALIAELGYEPYFLTVHDIVAYARSLSILCQGRGSAANSAVCYCLGITEVNPARAQVLFERFISRERNEPPDIDVDFEHQRREEVMQYIYAKYGRERAALAATLITYRPKSAIRDVGKALGLTLAQVDRLTRSLAWWDSRSALAERIREAGFDPTSDTMRHLLALADTLLGFPRHLSQHVGGFVISRGPLQRMVPIENAAMRERTVIQWDKDDLDALGLLKVDCLALGMLTAIRRTFDLIDADADMRRAVAAAIAPDRKRRQMAAATRKLTMDDIPEDDSAVYDMICKADTIGVFQIESRAQMSMLPRLKPRCFYDLVIEVAIVRPGPIQGGMVHPYLRRRRGLEPVRYPSEAVKAVLERTLGVPIFQEQVMQLAIVAAGFTPGEADQLRRSMAAWRRKGGLEPFEKKLIDGMSERGYPQAYARQIFRQIRGFGEYGFPESHSASFALLAYVSAWLKCHTPAAFTCALLNSQPMGFYSPSQLIQDARRHGVEVLPADVGMSSWDCTLEQPRARAECKAEPQASIPQPSLRLGLRMISGLGEAVAQRVMSARRLDPFRDVQDLVQRARLDRRDSAILARADALQSLTGSRRNAIWEAAGEPELKPLLAPSRFRETPARFPVPTEGEEIAADYLSLGLTLRRHPLALLRPRFARHGLLSAVELHERPHGRTARAAGIVTGRQRPGTASGVIFVTLEDETGYVNVIVWQHVFERQRRDLLGARLLAVHGTVEREGDVVHLIADRLIDLSRLLGRIAPASRDFH